MKTVLVIVLLAVNVGCATTEEIRASKPTLEGVFRGTQKDIASCVAGRMLGVGDIQAIPLLREDAGPSLINGAMQNSGIYYELKFSQLNDARTLIELRTRRVAFDTYSKPTDLPWASVTACAKYEDPSTAIRSDTRPDADAPGHDGL